MLFASDTVLLEVGLFGQALFSARFMVQWAASERAGRSVVPPSFWYLSVTGGLMLFVYACLRRDFVFIVGQGSGLLIYARNLYLIVRAPPAEVAVVKSSDVRAGPRVVRAGGRDSGRKAFLAPRFWPTWALIGLSKLGSTLPISWQLAAGRALGRLGYRVLPRHRGIARRNLEICFPAWTPPARERLLRRHFESLGMALPEMSIAWQTDIERMRERVTVSGLEHLQAARDGGRGVILLSGHTTCMEITGILLALLDLPVHTHFRRNRKNPLADRLALAGRGRYAAGQIDRKDVRRLVKVLGAGGIVLYSPDQLVREGKRSILVPFFGEPALMHTGLRDISRLSGACVVPYLPRRVDDRGRYELRFLPALEDFPGADAVADMARVNALLEAWIRLDPAQYLWIRPRFAKRGAPLPDPYTSAPETQAVRRASTRNEAAGCGLRTSSRA